MKFSAGWFKKVLRIGRKQDATELSGDAEAEAQSDTIKSAVVEVEKSDTGGARAVAAEGEDSQASEAGDEPDAADSELPENSKQSLWVRWLKVFRRQTEADQTETLSEDTETPQKTGMWATMTAVIMRRPKQAAATGAGSQEQGESQEKSKPEEESGNPTWRQRLMKLFQRKQPVVEDDEGEKSAERKSGEAALAPEKKRKRPDDGKPEEEETEEERQVGTWGRITAILSKKMVWVPLVLVVIALSVFAVAMMVLDMRKQEQAKVEALEKKYQKLQEENRKLQQAGNTVRSKPEDAKRRQARQSSSDQSGGDDAGGNDDCTVTDKASAAEVLKRCIEGFNAADRR